MAAISDNKYDVYNWIIKVIDSCETLDQINSAERLIGRFKIQSKDMGLNYWELHNKACIKFNLIKDEQK